MRLSWKSVSSYKMLFSQWTEKYGIWMSCKFACHSWASTMLIFFCIIPSLIHVLLKPTLCPDFSEEEAIDYSRVLNCWIVRSVKLWWLSLTWAANQNINSQNLGVEIEEIILLKKKSKGFFSPWTKILIYPPIFKLTLVFRANQLNLRSDQW